MSNWSNVNNFQKKTLFSVQPFRMNLLREVISNAEKIEMETLKKKVPEVLILNENLKEEVMKYIDKVYVFSSEPTVQTYLEKAKDLEVEMTELKRCIHNVKLKEVEPAIVQLEEYLSELDRADVSLKLASKIIEVHESLLKIREMQEEKLYVQAIEKVEEMMQRIHEDEPIEALLELKQNLREESMSLQMKLKNICADNVVFGDNKSPYVIKIKKVNDEMNQALIALYKLEESIPVLDKMTKYLWTMIYNPIVTYETTVSIGEDEDFHFLTLQVEESGKKGTYLDVFARILSVASFLHEHFDYTIEGERTTLNYINDDLRDNLASLIIKDCLAETIPSTAEGLQKYQQVIKDTEDFEAKLTEHKVFQKDTTSLIDYANNIDTLFINKKCRDYLDCALALMKKDLHDMVEVGEPHDASNPLSELLAIKFPQSCVSASTIELVHLGENIMDAAIKGSDVSAGRLVCTIQNIFKQYGDVTPAYHQKLLQSIPQQVALFHNNCMYISHTILHWNDLYKNKLPSILQLKTPLFEEEAMNLKQLGSQTFDKYVQGQIKQIEQILKDSELCNVTTYEKLSENAEKSIRQCLRQQELLKTVWQKVLPYSVYNETLGHIMDALCVFIVATVLRVEDIHSDAAEQLVDIFKIVLTRGPKLFTDPNEVVIYVKHWHKLKELVTLLNSSLMDIGDRWADGKGPLAMHFAPEDIKRLIRALFQNTDRRAAVLAKIF